MMYLLASGSRSDRQSQEAATPLAPQDSDSTLAALPDGTMVVNTSEIARDKHGYGGPVPLKVYFSHGMVERVEALPNQETGDFFSVVERSRLLEAWNGKTIGEALSMQVDGVSGATYSSRGVIATMGVALEYASQHISTGSHGEMKAKESLDIRIIIVTIVALMAAIIPLFVHNRRYHTVQLLLNASVLGFWGGTFLSHSKIIALMGGTVSPDIVATAVMLATAFIYPLFGKRHHYCNHVCPFGSLQELAGRCSRKKARIPARAVHVLEWTRRTLWALLILLLWTDILPQWTGWELFTAFSPAIAPIAITALAAAFLALSIIIPRPYCRFLCPTGTLFKAAEGKW